MFRPPRAPQKHQPLLLSCQTSNKIVRPGRLLQIAISRFSSQYSNKSSSQNKPKSITNNNQAKDTYTQLQQYYQTQQDRNRVLTSPKCGIENIEPNVRNGSKGGRDGKGSGMMGVGGFKIRYVSAHGRRSKENIQPNQQNNPIEQEVCKVQLKKPIILPSNSQPTLTSSQLHPHPNHQLLLSQTIKSSILRLLPPSSLSLPHLILSQSLFQSPQTLPKHLPPTFTYILYLHSPNKIPQYQSTIRQNRINIHYLLWNAQKYVERNNVISLKKVGQVSDVIVVHSVREYGRDVFVGDKEGVMFGCFAVRDAEDVGGFIRSMRVQDGVVMYDNKYMDCNQTQSYLNNSHITPKPTPIPKQSSSLSLSSPLSPLHFDQHYRTKLTQLIKLMHSQKSLPPTHNILSKQHTNNQYIKVTQPQPIAQLLDTMPVSTTTAYQMASQLIRNNGFNWKQIGEFRGVCGNVGG